MLLVQLTAGLALLFISAVMLWKYPTAAAATAIGAAILSDVFGIADSGFQLGVTLYPLDLSCAALLACCLVVSLRTRSLPRDFGWSAVFLLGLGLLNFARGALAFGVRAAGNDARLFTNLILPAVAFCLLGGALRLTVDQLVNCLVYASLTFAAIATARWAGVLPMPDVFDQEFREIERVLPADYALVIGQALIGVLGMQILRGFRLTGFLMAALFAGLAFALQHRSVWMAVLAGLAWLVVRSPRLARREWLQVSSLGLLMASVMALTPLIASGPFEKALKVYDSNVAEAEQEDSTWAWRLEGYTEATERVFSNGFFESVIGPASGRDLSSIARTEASIFIHDRYVHTLAKYGVLGLVLLVAWLFSITARIQRLSSQDRLERSHKAILEALLISTLVYFVPYAGGQLQGALLGAIWVASSSRPTEETGRTPEAASKAGTERLAVPLTLSR